MEFNQPQLIQLTCGIQPPPTHQLLLDLPRQNMRWDRAAQVEKGQVLNSTRPFR